MVKNNDSEIWAARDQTPAPFPDSYIPGPSPTHFLFLYYENFQTALFLESSTNFSLEWKFSYMPESWECIPGYEMLSFGNKAQK